MFAKYNQKSNRGYCFILNHIVVLCVASSSVLQFQNNQYLISPVGGLRH